MGRASRIVLPDFPHHVTQRGNHGEDIFVTDDDRRFYLNLLMVQSVKYGLLVEGYCLMTNHVHLIVTPTNEESLAKAVGRTHFHYSCRINEQHERKGHLWQSRFYSCPMDDKHYLAAMRYVERNPVRANMVPVAWEYPWSSAASHVGLTSSPLSLHTRRWERVSRGFEWKEFLGREDPDSDASFHNSTRRGHPLVSDGFLAKLETKLNRRLRPRSIGRPRGLKNMLKT